MLKSKWFWIAVIVLVPFIAIWITQGISWAIGCLIGVGVLILFLKSPRRRPRGGRRYIIYEADDDDEDYFEEEEYEDRSDRIRDLYGAPGLRDIHQRGLNDLRRRQQDSYNRTMRKLR